MPTPKPFSRVAIISVCLFVALNIVFYFLSDSYFASHREIVGGASVPVYSPERMMQVRTAFAMASAIITVCAALAALWPRAVGHLIPVLLGIGHLVGAVAALTQNAPAVLSITLLVSGGLMPVLAWYSLRESRPAWAFLAAICGVFAVVEFFGAPKVRDTVGISLWLTMILPGLNAVALVALVSLRASYVDPTQEPLQARDMVKG